MGNGPSDRLPTWLLGALPLLIVGVAAAVFAFTGGGLSGRSGPPAEDISVERTVLKPGKISLYLRNNGPDAVSIEQVFVNDAYSQFMKSSPSIGRLGKQKLNIAYPWVEGEAYEVGLLTSSGGVIDAQIEVAVETPDNDLSFFGLMALLGIYVGVIPVAIGMIWLPFVRRVSDRVIRFVMALTVGLLLFLFIDTSVEGIEIASNGAEAFGGATLFFLGGLFAYFGLMAVDAAVRGRKERGASGVSLAGGYLALLVAIGIGLHNLGEGLAIGAAYSVGAVALGAFLVVGFALHNTTEGLAIVAPIAHTRVPLGKILGLGMIAGAPAILGTWLGSAVYNPSISAFLFGVGAGAIAQVIQQLWPTMRDGQGRALYPLSVGGILAGAAILYLTGLLISV